MITQEHVLLIIIVLLGFMQVFQNIVWSKERTRLIDKIMSRSYAEYQQIRSKEKGPGLMDSLANLKASQRTTKEQAAIQAENEKVLTDLNQRLGL